MHISTFKVFIAQLLHWTLKSAYIYRKKAKNQPKLVRIWQLSQNSEKVVYLHWWCESKFWSISEDSQLWLVITKQAEEPSLATAITSDEIEGYTLMKAGYHLVTSTEFML